ncbi:hypothetical protein Q7C36_021029 [Tachysurus vachellii]|uniref:Uncharacterized protein n=1 Tax=Tachysurus vachellii TaxID=175792 RepID=A0AA88IV98_TACVA|nr:hypothetical protein Q7C36_021029 [Tachysurus vachellii]
MRTAAPVVFLFVLLLERSVAQAAVQQTDEEQAVRLALASSPETFSPGLKPLLGKRRVFDFSMRALKK